MCLIRLNPSYPSGRSMVDDMDEMDEVDKKLTIATASSMQFHLHGLFRTDVESQMAEKFH